MPLEFSVKPEGNALESDARVNTFVPAPPLELIVRVLKVDVAFPFKPLPDGVVIVSSLETVKVTDLPILATEFESVATTLNDPPVGDEEILITPVVASIETPAGALVKDHVIVSPLLESATV